MPSFTTLDSAGLRLPARLAHARELALQRELAEHDPGHAELLVHGMRAARDAAAPRHPGRARVARQLRERLLHLELLFHRELRVLELLAERGALLGVLLDQLGAALIPQDLRLLGHSVTPGFQRAAESRKRPLQAQREGARSPRGAGGSGRSLPE